MNKINSWKEEQIRLVCAFRSCRSQPGISDQSWEEIKKHEEEGLKLGLTHEQMSGFNKAVVKEANGHRSVKDVIETLLKTDGKK
jgi:hypothetical protein